MGNEDGFELTDWKTTKADMFLKVLYGFFGVALIGTVAALAAIILTQGVK